MQRFVLLAAFVLSLSVMAHTQSDDFARKYQDRLSNKPADLEFHLKLATDKSQFRVGEIIPLELAFSTKSLNKFSFNTASYDRSGRLMIDDIILDKMEGISDPLNDYFEKGFSVFMGGGLHSIPMLDAKPQIIRYDLNEWYRIDKVGKYRLYIDSGRVSLGERYKEGSKPVTAVSNFIEFEIISADNSWQQTKLAEIVKNLVPIIPEKTHTQACRELRFLGTREAASEIILRLADDDGICSFNFYMGLHGSSNREFIAAEMGRWMDKPEFAVTHSFLQNLALISYFVKYPEPLMPYPVEASDEESHKIWKTQSDIREAQKQAEYVKCTNRLRLALRDKKGKALAISTDTYFSFLSDDKKTDALDPLIKVFRDLPVGRQRSILEYNWDKIASSKMLPILREIRNRIEKQGSLKYEQRELFEVVIKRTYELAPEEGRNIILAETRRPKLRVSSEILLLLPDKELPEFEDDWIGRATDLSQDYPVRESFVELLERYGTKKSLPQLQAIYGDRIGIIECGLQENVIRYFLKHDSLIGTESIKTAMSARRKTKCYNSVFDNIPQKYWSDDIEQIAVSYLDDNNLAVVKSVVDALGKFGSSNVKEKIWNRFEQLSQEMKLDNSSLDKTFGNYSYPIQTIERSFVQALTKSSNWKLNDAEIRKLSLFCVSTTCKNEIESLQP